MNVVKTVLKWGVLGFLGLVLGVVAVERYAAESGEVVVMTAPDAAGEPVSTRLWVVDHDGAAYLRVGGDGSGWFDRLQAAGTVQVQRGDATGRFIATPVPALSVPVNERMAAKYGWADTFIGNLVGGRDGSIPIRLTPAGAGQVAANDGNPG